MKNKPFSVVRFAVVAAGLMVAASSFASVLTPFCGGEKDDQHESKDKSETKKEKEQPKKPTNPA